MHQSTKYCLAPGLMIVVFALAGCQSERPEPEMVATSGAIVTPVPDVNEFSEMTGLLGYGFRYSGAPLALSLEIYLQTIAQSDWDDPEKRKEIHRNAPADEDRIVDWDSVPPGLISSYESGKMSSDDTELFVLSPTGKILFTIPQDWHSDAQPAHVSIAGPGRGAAFKWLRFGVSKKFRDFDQRAILEWGTDPPVAAEPIQIDHGQSASLIRFSQSVRFENLPKDKSSVHRLVVELRARCLHPPAAEHSAEAGNSRE